MTRSLAILTDALESVVNIVSGLLGLYSLHLSAKPKDADHPYGHGKVEFITVAVEGTLITIAGFFIIFKSVNSFYHPHTITKMDFGIILIAVSGIINFIAGTVCIRTGKRNNSLPLIAGGKHLKTDTYTTIGILAGLVIIYLTNDIFLDGVVACIFALIIIFTGFKILRSSIAGIMDEADLNLLNRLVEILNKKRRENWIDLHNLRIIKYGSKLHLDCHLTVPWYLNVNETHSETEALSALIKNEFNETVELFVHSDACMEFSCRICPKQNCVVRKHALEKKIIWAIKNISRDSKHDIMS